MGTIADPITVLLVDDQPIIAEAVRQMLADETDIVFHYCSDPTKAIPRANEIQPTVILQDLVMPDVDGLLLVKFFRANPETRETPMIVLPSKEEAVTRAEAFARGANDYLVKLPDRVELVARVRYHSEEYVRLLQRNEAYDALEKSQQQLARQIEAAREYVMSLLPKPTTEPVQLDYRFIPCDDLGGDTFGYHWIDDDHLALYLLDVTGHGLGSALFSVTIMDVIRASALPNTDFRIPGQVLGALNDAFPMESRGNKCFTIWYGTWQRSTSTLKLGGGGHPPALLFEGDVNEKREAIQLESDGPMMGMMPWPEFPTFERVIQPGSRLYVHSDGVHEIHLEDGSEWELDAFVDFMADPVTNGESIMDRLLKHARDLKDEAMLDDDFSIFEAQF